MASPDAARATARLTLHRPRLADAAALFAFLGDAAAMAYTVHNPSLRAVRRRIAAHARQARRDGFGPWTIRRQDGTVIGWGGLYTDPCDPGWGVEVGYAFHPAAWGQGYASELVAACTALADGPLGLAELRAFAHPDNHASRRVLEKAGFVAQREVAEMHRILYARAGAATRASTTSRHHT